MSDKISAVSEEVATENRPVEESRTATDELSMDELDAVAGGRAAPISKGVLNGKAISKPAPAYPAIA